MNVADTMSGHVVGGLVVVLGLAVLGLLLAAPALPGRAGQWVWLLVGFPVAALRIAASWRRTMSGCGLAQSRKPVLTVVAGLVGARGTPPSPIVPRFGWVRPTSNGLRLRVRMLPGQEVQDFAEKAAAFAGAWRMHAVRVTSGAPGFVELAVLVADPLANPSIPARMADSEPLRVPVGVRESGEPWVMDFRLIPHWLIVGATRSGKSTLINALVAALAPRAVALVGIDCKGGIEMALYERRLSALATNRAEGVRLLGAVLDLIADRQRQVRAARVRNVWAMPDVARPVPVVVIVDELAELFLYASREDKGEAQAAAVNLARIAQIGAAFGVFLVVAGQRVGSDLGPGVTLLRAQLAGRVCHRVADPETAVMVLGDLNPDALRAAQAITPEEAGTAIVATSDGWQRARSVHVTEADAERIADECAALTPDLPELADAIADTDGVMP